MSELPKGWVDTTIGQIADLSSGFGFPKHLQGKTEGRFPFAKVSDISVAVRSNSSQLVGAENYVDDSDMETLRARPIPSGSTVFAKIGEALKLNRRALATVEVVLDNNCMALSPRPGIDPRFLFEFMRTIDLGPLSIATTVPSIRRGDVENLPLGLPPEREQRRIVAKLDSLLGSSTRARHELDLVPNLIERYKQAILANAFSGELLSNFSYGKAVKLSHYVRQLDQGWSPKCEAFASTSPERWAVLKTTAVQPIHFQENENKQLPSGLTPRPAIEVNAGDVLITRAGPRSRVGITCIVRTTRPRLMLADKIYRLKCHSELADPAFVALMLNAPQALVLIEQMKTGISDSGLNLTQDKFLNLPIPDVPLEEQSEIVRRVELAFIWLDRIVSEHARADHLLPKLDQAILAKAFRGELVPQDPNDEPASVLLERIRTEREGNSAPRRRRTNA